ncbi:cytosolic phospholipase A2 gamma-like [Sinocyclocheilus anshuiensis]|uniref:cytosolic phospholipase A2 gamma-like n=1 Tax=Sinocyclocheilus anshuiensis TaxID=1608454 RepID=UPI0007B7FED0|nr:PREDICTED: cytosolic phospholipase A2 gamma-like [Sinocyclocheilus anshuiensis]
MPNIALCSVIDTFVEITPYETGYSITGAFVDTSSFGSQFDQGVKIKDQPEMDMLFLQGLCGSGLASLGKTTGGTITFNQTQWDMDCHC